MEKFRSLSPNCLLFDLASRVGSLEGYLYAEEKVDKNYLPNWLKNIEQEFGCLPADVRAEILSAYLELLQKVLALLEKSYGHDEPNAIKVAGMISALSKGERFREQ